MDYRGTIIEESLGDQSILRDLTILNTRVEAVTDRHKTPWLSQWTLHTIQVPEGEGAAVARRIQRAIDAMQPGSWYVDFKNDVEHFIIYKDKIFKIGRDDEAGYQAARTHGINLGIPEYQLDFSPGIA